MSRLLLFFLITRADMAIAKISYRTYFGECPSRTAGALTLKLVDEFDKTKSLKKIKEKILEEGLEEKHFLASYNIRIIGREQS